MVLYPLVKLIHVLSATVLFGTGLGSAFFLRKTYRSGDVDGLVTVTRQVVLVDRLFIAPAVVLQLLTGAWLVLLTGHSITEPWILAALGLYVVTGLCWLPAAWLQLRMRDAVLDLPEDGQELPPEYHRHMRLWTRLGEAAFVAVLAIFYLMVFKPQLW